jgi:hypothetical protein
MKFVLFVGALVAVGWLVVTKLGPFSAASRDENTCERFASLCSGDDEKRSESTCAEDLAQMRKKVGAEAVDRAGACIDEAESCIEASGCVAGASVGVLKDFVSGFERALK